MDCPQREPDHHRAQAYSLGNSVSFFSRVHASPEDAIVIHQHVKSKRSLGIHWGAWALTDEPVTEPPIRLAKAAKAAGLPEGEFGVLDAIGATAIIDV